MREKLRAGGRWPGATSDPLDQPDAEALLELADLQADGRLCKVEPVCSRGEAALLDHLDEGVELIEIEPAHTED